MPESGQDHGADAQAAGKLDDAYGALPAPAPIDGSTSGGTDGAAGADGNWTAAGRI